MLGNWRLMETYLDGVRKVTGEDLVRVAEKYFSDDRRTVGILVPVKVSP
jgi:predicted Zn-dependent peptidase